MEDLMAQLQGVLGTAEGQQQLKNLQEMFSGNQSQNPPNNNSQPQNQSGGFDFSALSGLFNPAGGNSNGNGTNSANAGQGQASSPDLSSLLSGLMSSAGGGGGGTAPPIDMNMILKLQQVFQSMNVNDKNSQLLLALKPHFSEKRKSKIDQAISMMRLFAMMPMLKESGIFAGL